MAQADKQLVMYSGLSNAGFHQKYKTTKYKKPNNKKKKRRKKRKKVKAKTLNEWKRKVFDS